MKLRDYYFKLVDKEGAKSTTIVWLRTSMEAKISVVAPAVAGFIRIEQEVQGLP